VRFSENGCVSKFAVILSFCKTQDGVGFWGMKSGSPTILTELNIAITLFIISGLAVRTESSNFAPEKE